MLKMATIASRCLQIEDCSSTEFAPTEIRQTCPFDPAVYHKPPPPCFLYVIASPRSAVCSSLTSVQLYINTLSSQDAKSSSSSEKPDHLFPIILSLCVSHSVFSAFPHCPQSDQVPIGLVRNRRKVVCAFSVVS